MLKVTIKFAVCSVFCCALSWGCEPQQKRGDGDADRHYTDSISEVRIDSAYRAISDSCDSMRIHKLPQFTDSLMRGDTAFMNNFFDSAVLFHDADQKVEKVVRQLKGDCDTNLRRETYKRARLLLKVKRSLHTKRKA